MAVTRFFYTDEMIAYVREIAPGRFNKEITELFNERFGLDKTVSAIRSMKRKNNITSGVKGVGPNRVRLFTDEQEEFIKANVKGNYNETLANLVNEKFDLNITPSQIKSLKRRRGWSSGLTGHFEKGHKTWNAGMKGLRIEGSEKGWFRKGQQATNYLPVGSERIDNKDGYVLVKVQDDGEWSDRWKHKHVVEWEKHHGKVPDGHVVVLLDGDKTNCHIDNLMVISRRTLSYLNKGVDASDDVEHNKLRIRLAELEALISEKELTGGDREKFNRYLEISERNGISYMTFTNRIRRGWNIEDAATLPIGYRYKKPQRR